MVVPLYNGSSADRKVTDCVYGRALCYIYMVCLFGVFLLFFFVCLFGFVFFLCVCFCLGEWGGGGGYSFVLFDK